MANSRPASELPCLFEALARKYPESLLPCEIKENQTWRFASGDAAVKRINIMAKYFPELFLLIDFLEDYSLCQKHYNQVVAKDLLLKNLKKTDTLITSLEETEENNQRKRIRHEAQVTLPDPEVIRLTRELSDTQKKIEESERQRIYYVDTIKKYQQIIEELKDKNTSLLSENEKLKEKLNTIFDDQQSRIDSITIIAQKERKNLYDDIINLINDKERFSLDSLLEYSTSE
jgi:hypothetical protein